MEQIPKVEFGYSSAEVESTEAPELLLDGYVDFHGASNAALTGPKFLFLGYKGSGKSAIAERLKLLYQGNYEHFVTYVSLADFPFSQFAKIIRGDLEPEAKFPTAWGWVLGIFILDSLRRDDACSSSHGASLQDPIDFFQNMGFLPNPDLVQVIRKTTQRGFRFAIPSWLESGVAVQQQDESSGDPTLFESATNITEVVHHLRALFLSIRSRSRHIVVLDGLDEILTKRDIQYRSLGGLIFEVNRMNRDLRRAGSPIKIVLLCRTDVFDRIPGSNKNKVRQDASIDLDWYSDPWNPEDSLLVQAARLRAALVIGDRADLFRDFFPEFVEDRHIMTYLLDLTRHTPRDFLQLLKSIQEVDGFRRFTNNHVVSGVSKYSNKYFLAEVYDEMDGLAERPEREARREVVQRVIEAIGRVRKTEFDLGELLRASRESRTGMDEQTLVGVLEQLFECSAIGNVFRRADGNRTYAFRYRHRHAVFSTREPIMVHRGLWKALKLG